MTIFSFSPFGYEGALVTVEVDLRRGIPAVDLVGLADGAVKESRERMRSAIRNSGFEFPTERVLISLSPSDLRKEGSGFDLPIALAVLAAKERDDMEELSAKRNIMVAGELELSGKVRGVRGIHAAIATAIDNGIKFCIIPEENRREADDFTGIKIFAASSLAESFSILCSICSSDDFEIPEQEEEPQSFSVEFSPISPEEDLLAVKGQAVLIRALQIAACGGHNLLVCGPPGCGKTLALQRFGSILPLLSGKDRRAVTRIYSLAGLIPKGGASIRQAPFRSPHQSSSLEGIVGGGRFCAPGEISLAHGGVLFLDEASEFRTSVLQTLRIPLETGRITLSRAGRHTMYPARFQLLMATNPCPCGNLGSPDKICTCPPAQVEKFWRKFSAPLLDRVDLRLVLFQKNIREISKTICDGRFLRRDSFSSGEIRQDVKRVREVCIARQGFLNCEISADNISQLCQIPPDLRDFLNGKADSDGFTKRGMAACLKVARTIADIAKSEKIEECHLVEALAFRKNSGVFDEIF